MAPPRGRGGRRGTGRGGGKRSTGRGTRRSRTAPESNPENEELYTDVDRFHMQKDNIKFGGGAGDSSDSDDLDGSEEEEGVMDLEGAGDGSSEDDDEGSEEDDSDGSDLPELPEHVRRAAMGASSDEDDDSSDGDGQGGGKFSAGWGKSRSSYYNADTADLEIGQEFEDAEAEEEAARELQRASYKRLDPADYGEEGGEGEGGEEAIHMGKQEGEGARLKGKGKTSAKRRRGEEANTTTSGQGAALLAMRSDLEQIALGEGGEVETSVFKRDTSKLSRRDKLELVLSEAPELPALLGEVRAQLGTLTESVQPLVSNVTSEIGASKDGLVYLRTRQQLLLAYCMNVCFYMILKAKGEPAKGHPVVRRLLSLRALLEDMSILDDKMSSQVDLLLRALRSGIDLAGAGATDSDDAEEEEEGGGGESEGRGRSVSVSTERGKIRVGTHGGGGDGGCRAEAEEGEGEDVDEEGLEEEEARFMGGGGRGNSSEAEDGAGEGAAQQELSKSAKKKRKRAAREKALVEARAKLAAGGGNDDGSLGDFGDEDVDESTAMNGSGGGNLLQGMVNRISQRGQSTTARKGRGLQGDLDVPVRERDQTIRVRRPAPGDKSDSEEGGAGGDGSGTDCEDDDLMGGGGGGFMDGLPPGLLEGLGRGGGDDDREAGGQKKKKAASKEGKRGRDDGEEGSGGEGGDGEDDFYDAVAKEKERKKRAKKEKYHPQARIAGALEAELEAERAAKGETKRGASYTIIKNRGLTPHKNKLNRNPRSKKREAFRKATIRRKGQVRDIRTGEADAYGGESTGIKSNVTRSRKLKG